MWRLWFYPLLICIGLAAYYAVDHLPDSWREKLKGWKTYVLGGFAIAFPEVVDTLQQLSGLGIFEWLGAKWATVSSQVIGILAIAARFRTDKES